MDELDLDELPPKNPPPDPPEPPAIKITYQTLIPQQPLATEEPTQQPRMVLLALGKKTLIIKINCVERIYHASSQIWLYFSSYKREFPCLPILFSSSQILFETRQLMYGPLRADRLSLHQYLLRLGYHKLVVLLPDQL